jgi:uncharacterized protein YgiM (DUF1202 family)
MVLFNGYSFPKMLAWSAIAVFLLSCSTTAPTIHQDPVPPSPVKETAGETQKEKTIKPSQPVPAAPSSKSIEVIKPAPSSPPPAVSPPPKPPVSKPAPPLRVTQVVWASVNLREGPGTNYKVIGNVKKGTTLTVLEEKEGWLRIRLKDGKEAWITKAATSEAPKTAPPAQQSPPKPRPM